jgi:hypothetical protein
MFMMLTLLGSDLNTQTTIKSLVDPVTKKCLHLKGKMLQGTVERNFEVEIKNDSAVISSTLMGEPKTLYLEAGVLFGSDEVYSNVKEEFVNNNAQNVSYEILEAIEAKIQNSTFTKAGEDTIELAGRSYETLIIEQHNNATGVKIKYWLAPELDYYAKFEVMNRKVYLADHTVVDKIKVANMDASIMTKTNVSVSDVQALDYMKLKVEIEPTGVNLKPEDLNVPGQKFVGTVTNNLVEGIFEIEHTRYKGENAPPFPPEYKGDESLQKYLRAASNIQSDDPVIIDKALEITGDADNSWEAAKRMSKWVAENIHYAIPGGGSAKGAYDMRAGECGAHSMLLAAFCRAVGIPARVVFGGMYVPNYGGAFGQHAWNEIYMGEAGWIPVDATAFEIDFVDAGHIRIYEHLYASSTFNAKSIEVLDYKINGKRPGELFTPTLSYAPYLGKYKEPESGKVFEVLEKEGNLSVDIPGRAVLPFNEEDELGRWFCKLSNRLYIHFDKDEEELVNRMAFHNLVLMNRQKDTIDIDQATPEDIKPLLGNYYFPAVNAVFKVDYIDDNLTIYDPTENKTIKLQSPDENGGWLDEFNKNTIYFERDANGKVTALRLDAVTYFEKE